MKKVFFFVAPLLAVIMCISFANAGPLTLVGGYGDGRVNENCVNSQIWDLEGMSLNGNTLTIVGGYNFRDGQLDSSREITFTTGDIWIKTAGSSSYNYVVDITGVTGSGWQYQVYDISHGYTATNVYFDQNFDSLPWVYNSGGTATGHGGSVFYQSNLTDTQTGFSGGTHYAISVDLDFLLSGTNFTAHYTYGCGNDYLDANGSTPVPEPGTILLLGSGMVALAAYRKKSKKA